MLEMSTTNETMGAKLLQHINQNTNEIKNSILQLNDSILVNQTENKVDVLSQIIEMKKTYIDDLKQIIEMNTYDKIDSLIEKNNSLLINRTNDIINDVVLKNQPIYNTQLQETLQTFYSSISKDTKELLKFIDTNTLKEYITNFELKTSILLQNVQQPIYSFITATEERINHNIHSVKDPNMQKTINNIDDFLTKYRSGDTKIAQTIQTKQLSSVLTRLYNSAEIATNPTSIENGNTSCILLKRLRKTNILVCNYDSTENISMDDINTFLLLTEEHNTNGIFISQNSGICTKKNYQIEMNSNNNIIVYLHNVEYCPLKIQSAVDIIDNLAMKFRQLKGTSSIDDVSISKDILDSINSEYQLFLTQKNAVIEVFKESQKKILAQVDELRFPCLDKYLSTKYSLVVQKPGLKCDLCKSFTGNNLKALAAHKRGCIRKRPQITQMNNTLIMVP